MAATHTTAQFGDLPPLDFDSTSITFPSSLPASSASTSPVFAAPPPASQSAHGPPTIGAFQCIVEAQNQWIKYWNNLALSIIPPERIPEYLERFYSDPAGFQKACADAEFSRGWIHIMRGMEKEVDNWWVSKGWEGWWAEYERGGGECGGVGGEDKD